MRTREKSELYSELLIYCDSQDMYRLPVKNILTLYVTENDTEMLNDLMSLLTERIFDDIFLHQLKKVMFTFIVALMYTFKTEWEEDTWMAGSASFLYYTAFMCDVSFT